MAKTSKEPKASKVARKPTPKREQEKKPEAIKGRCKNLLTLVRNMLNTMRVQVKSGSCADFARLLQLQRELTKERESESIRQIEVKWIEPEANTEKQPEQEPACCDGK